MRYFSDSPSFFSGWEQMSWNPNWTILHQCETEKSGFSVTGGYQVWQECVFRCKAERGSSILTHMLGWATGPHLATGVARLLVDVELKELVLVEEASPGLVDEEVVRILLGDHVRVVSVAQWRPDLNRLTRNLDKTDRWDWSASFFYSGFEILGDIIFKVSAAVSGNERL